MIDRKKFFDGIRQGPFPGKLSASQVQGCEMILANGEALGIDLRWIAYELATAFHETGQRMQPIIETTLPGEKTPPSVDTAIKRLNSSFARGRMPWVKTVYWRKDANGLSWLGRGLPQVTHLTNYRRAEKELGVPFTKNPDLMLELKYAVPVMHRGMTEAWFTKYRLSDFFNAKKTDWVGARRIINGQESAEKVAGYAKAFYADLMLAA